MDGGCVTGVECVVGFIGEDGMDWIMRGSGLCGGRRFCDVRRVSGGEGGCGWARLRTGIVGGKSVCCERKVCSAVDWVEMGRAVCG